MTEWVTLSFVVFVHALFYPNFLRHLCCCVSSDMLYYIAPQYRGLHDQLYHVATRWGIVRCVKFNLDGSCGYVLELSYVSSHYYY